MPGDVKYSVLPAKLGGGPHNLGDPNDKSLRKVEKDVLIPQKMRNKAREEKCVKEVKEFSKCCKDASFAMVYKCREENTALKACLTKWYTDEQFREQCTQEYLHERSEFRRTGVGLNNKLKRMQSS
ncbi:COX assembly mitochondrial protein homolog [Colletes gigas]|uniref:COX assembly mitochondrial protein homolog n=1 Tax=Colletes gigas TaxID=935657 RepID=UPI001C9B2884|nr:COX assembly mitochondrial protein homolog [Colletes gigas]